MWSLSAVTAVTVLCARLLIIIYTVSQKGDIMLF